MELEIKTPRWFLPYLEPKRYKGIKGGRGSGKSHTVGEALVEKMIMQPNCKMVCIREIQRSLKFSSKALIESKIQAFGVSHLFDITQNEIKRIGGEGIMIFQGMQDHTADSIKSLEGFDLAWVEEAQNLSHRSLQLLRPTIRKAGSEIWFTWNPDQETDAVDAFFNEAIANNADGFLLSHVNYDANPFLPDELLKEMEYDRRYNSSTFDHVWNGAYNIKSDAQVFNGKYCIEDFEPKSNWNGPYHGMDFGFAQDPTAVVRCWVYQNCLYVDRSFGKVGLELDDTAQFFLKDIPNLSQYTLRADSARPESISYLKRHGLPRIEGVKKWKGSVEDGIAHIKSYDKVVIHPDCEEIAKEFRLYSYKVDKHSGDILPEVLDENNHYIDALRYALNPLIQPSGSFKQAAFNLYR
ncbi:terminase [Pasteurellaceae bacterium Pebbles2]|nr:terminase [Pasteurellaceae bacterium Pebbles2]